MTIRRYVLTADQFDGLAAGYGDAGAIAVLHSAQLAKHKLLLRAVLRAVDEPLRRRAGLDAATALIVEAERVRPDVVTDVLRHPHLDAWATRCLRRLRPADGRARGPSPVDELGHLAAIAASTAARAGLDCSIDVPARAGTVCLPGLGCAVGLGAGPAHVKVRAAGQEITITGPTGTVVRGGAGWQPRRTVPLEPGFTLAIEDQDPFRDCYHWRPTPRLDDARATRLAALLHEAWQRITRAHPEHAAAMRGSLRSVVPLEHPRTGSNVSAASRRAYGSVALAVPASAAELVLLLLHECMHMKLGALLDLVELHRQGAKGDYHAPWRLDPRPVGALLQGVYAHAGVTDYWRVRRRMPDATRVADVEFAYWREQNRIAVQRLAESGELSPLGERFVSGLRSTLDRWQREPVPAEVVAGTAAMALAQSTRWRLRNWDPGDVEPRRLARAWRGGRPPEATNSAGTLRDDVPAESSGLPGLVGLIRARLVDDAAPPARHFEPADTALLAGDHGGAVAAYLDRLRRDGADDDAWIGLAVALDAAATASASADEVTRRAARSLRCRPDLVRATARLLSEEGDPVPVVDLAAWLAQGLPQRRTAPRQGADETATAWQNLPP